MKIDPFGGMVAILYVQGRPVYSKQIVEFRSLSEADDFNRVRSRFIELSSEDIDLIRHPEKILFQSGCGSDHREVSIPG